MEKGSVLGKASAAKRCARAKAGPWHTGEFVEGIAVFPAHRGQNRR